jgi:hypothetical protein
MWLSGEAVRAQRAVAQQAQMPVGLAAKCVLHKPSNAAFRAIVDEQGQVAAEQKIADVRVLKPDLVSADYIQSIRLLCGMHRGDETLAETMATLRTELSALGDATSEHGRAAAESQDSTAVISRAKAAVQAAAAELATGNKHLTAHMVVMQEKEDMLCLAQARSQAGAADADVGHAKPSLTLRASW